MSAPGDEAPWLAGQQSHALLAAVAGRGKSRRLRLCAVAFCRRVLHLLPEDRYQRAVQVAEAFADRQAPRRHLTDEDEQISEPVGSLAELRLCGFAARWHAARAIRHAAGAARGFAVSAATEAATALALARQPPEAAMSSTPAFLDSFSRAIFEAQQAQLALIREIVRNPCEQTPAMPPSLPASVRAVAQAAYEERLPSCELDPLRLSVLADALEDVGATDGSILSHLRSPGPHVRGCWALDLVLGKR